jgi:hypothetical protein
MHEKGPQTAKLTLSLSLFLSLSLSLSIMVTHKFLCRLSLCANPRRHRVRQFVLTRQTEPGIRAQRGRAERAL